jgi:hypothetical protein
LHHRNQDHRRETLNDLHGLCMVRLERRGHYRSNGDERLRRIKLISDARRKAPV